MKRVILALVIVFTPLLASCAGNSVAISRPTAPQVQQVDFERACAHATRDSLPAECFIPNADERAKIGSFCELHPHQPLMLDTVRIAYGFACPDSTGERPGLFIHSRLAACGGCLIDVPFTEVAYCAECRRVRREWEAAPGHR